MTEYMKQQKGLLEQKQSGPARRWETCCRVFLLVSVGLFGLLYVVETSTVSTKGYDISDLQKQLVAMRQEEQALDLQIAEFRSMASIQERLAGMDLVAVTDAEFVSETGVVVARR